MLIKDHIKEIVQAAFVAAGFDSRYGQIGKCKLEELGDFSATGALNAAKEYHKSPRDIAHAVVKQLEKNKEFESIRIDGPGYINLKLAQDFIVTNLSNMLADENLGCKSDKTLKVVIDYGGPNVAKPLHVGHLRSAIIGEALKRIGKFNGHEVVGDVHLGDWGLQMGMLIHELSIRNPKWPYFDANKTKGFPLQSPVAIADLMQIYPDASGKARLDDEYLEACRKATSELQDGRPGFRALWQHIVNVSVADLKQDYDALNVTFDFWLGESDADQYLPKLIKKFEAGGYAYENNGALIVEIAKEEDTYPVPPVILRKSDGAILYHATDIATIYQRVKDFDPNYILYIVDKRQALHFEQVFRCVHKVGIVPEHLRLEHIQFGTMNGKDGRPFKTREGGILQLKDLISMVTNKALERLEQGGYMEDFDAEEKQQVAKEVGMAALKFGDLNNVCMRDYIFDLDRFLEFKGKTGPYLQYSAVRAKSILSKATDKINNVATPQTDAERKLMLTLLEFPAVVKQAFTTREPSVLCEYSYQLANAFSLFYDKVKILAEKDQNRRKTLLSLVKAFLTTITVSLDLLGITVPDKM